MNKMKQRSFRFPADVEEYLTLNKGHKGDLTCFVVKCLRDHRRLYGSGKGKLQLFFVSSSHSVIHETIGRFSKVAPKIDVLQINPVAKGHQVSLAGDGDDLQGFISLVAYVVSNGAEDVHFYNHSNP